MNAVVVANSKKTKARLNLANKEVQDYLCQLRFGNNLNKIGRFCGFDLDTISKVSGYSASYMSKWLRQ